MFTKKLVLGSAVAAIGLMGFASVGLVAAQTGPTPPATPPATAPTSHDQMQAALAKALGISVDELNADLGAGKTVLQIASAKGVDLTSLMTTLQGTHPAGYGPGNHGAMTGQGHDQMQSAFAKALGISVDDLNAQLKAGKTVPEIASAKGIDLSTLMTTLQGTHPAGYGPGMMAGGATHTMPNGMTHPGSSNP